MYNAQKIEKEILMFWKKKKILEKARKKNEGSKKTFYMMDGPPYATGHIHMGTALNKVLKDIFMRYQRLQGKDVFDRPGYDTHGLPIENKVEKKLGFEKKEDIEKYGIKKFVNECKKFATKYIDVMNEEFANLGVWMDFENPYLTLKNSYIETIWGTFKKANEKGLLYLGKYPVHACPHCETAVAYNEIEYKKQKDTSVYVKFKFKNEDKFLIIWTTTPWTLPSNTGVMVNPKFDYVEAEVCGERWIIAKERMKELMKKVSKDYKIKREFKGKELKDKKYENPLSKHLKLKETEKMYRIILNERYVNLEEGTGLVHTAPGCGKEDFDAGQKENLPIVSLVEIDGTLTPQAGKYKGKKAREVDSEIIEDLEKSNSLVYKEEHEHDYPICWRCKTPLIMISVPQWFFKISKIHEKLIKENDRVNWSPSYMKLRMKAWLEGISDWPISRSRYWGTPLPIWECDKCGKRVVVGSAKELEKKSKTKVKDLHKPEIDKISWKCECGGRMKRVPEVLDVWFDSGVSSWAALDFSKNGKLFRKFWPADLNIEGKDQFRGWWNSQLILSEIRFGKKPFKNILVHGMVLDLGKIKMSKSLDNIVSPRDAIEKYGRDGLRYYFSKISKGEDFAYDEREFKDIRNVFRVLVNLNNFVNQIEKGRAKTQIEDKWILSKLNKLISETEKRYEKFWLPEVIQKLEEFVIKDFSKTYIQIIRERSGEVYELMNEIRTKLLKILSPIIPFVTEKIWQDLKQKKIVKEESVHLSSWPRADKKKINKKLEADFETALQIIEKGLAERDRLKIGLRWPLAKAIINHDEKPNKKLEKIILNQLNVRKIEFKKGKEISVELDTKLTPELEAEGYAREVSRKVQTFRKKLGLEKKDRIELQILVGKELGEILEKNKNFIKERTGSKKLEVFTDAQNKTKENFKNKINFSIKDKRGEIIITKR